MEYKTIIEDVIKYRDIIAEEGLSNDIFVGSLCLDLCLSKKGIDSTIISSYLISDDTYWWPFIWKNIQLESQKMQRLASANNSNGNIRSYTPKYNLNLKEIWLSYLDTKKDQPMYILATRKYNMFKDKGEIWRLEEKKSAQLAIQNKKAWEKVAKRAKNLQTFEHIVKYTNLVSLVIQC